MRIAQVSPLHEAVPPRFYGGTERIVSYLTEELVQMGHEVTLFASGDSVTQARLVSCCDEALRLNPNCVDRLAYSVLQMESVIREAPGFDAIHFHTDYMHFPWSRRFFPTALTTLHGRLDLLDIQPLYRVFSEIPLVSISNAQRRPMPPVNWRGTVYHGLPADLLQPGQGQGGYLAFLGRVSPEKGLDTAIDIAKRIGIPLRIAAKIDPQDQEYFDAIIRPAIDHPLIEWCSEIGEHEKQAFLGDAMALMFTINWPEPFGLVMIEAMACGTPVIAFRHGSVPEVLDEGGTGFIVDTAEEAMSVIAHRLPHFERTRCRQIFDLRFTARRMACDYLALYAEPVREAVLRPVLRTFG